MSDELIKKVSGALFDELCKSGAFVGDKSMTTGLPLVYAFVDLDHLAKTAIDEVLFYQTTAVIEQMKAGQPMPDEPGHPELRYTSHGTMLVFSQPPEMESAEVPDEPRHPDVCVLDGPSLHGEHAELYRTPPGKPRCLCSIIKQWSLTVTATKKPLTPEGIGLTPEEMAKFEAIVRALGRNERRRAALNRLTDKEPATKL